MKHLIILLSAISFFNVRAQESYIRIYSSGAWQIENLFTQGVEGSQRNIYVRHVSDYSSTDPENGAVKKYSGYGSIWTIPAKKSLATICAQCVDPPMVWTECLASPYIKISPADTNFIVIYRITSCAMCPDAGTLITWSGADNWSSYYQIFGCGGSMIYPNGGDIDPQNDSICYYGYANGNTSYEPGIFKSTNRGVNWYLTCLIPNLRNTSPPGIWNNEESGGFIRVCPMNTDHIFAVHRDYLLLSTDAGSSFAPTVVPPPRNIIFDPGENMIYGFTDHAIYASSDQGITWTSSETPFVINALEANHDDSSILFAGSAEGLYRSTNKGLSWHLYNNVFAPSRKVIGIVKQPGSGDTVMVCTADAVYKVFRDQLTYGSENNASVPGSFVLHQNYPNPFNPETTIEFECPKETYVSLTVYDALGRKIEDVVNGVMTAGLHSAVFNSSQYGSGVYFCRLQAEGITKSIVMIAQK